MKCKYMFSFSLKKLAHKGLKQIYIELGPGIDVENMNDSG